MKKYLLGAAAVAALAAPAQARDNSPYVGLEAGALFSKTTDVSIGDDSSDFIEFLDIDHKTGFDVDLIGGYDFGMVRLEAELGYKKAKHDEYNFFDVFEVDADGSRRTWSLMGNALIDLGNEDAFSYYVGGGLGFASVKTKFEADEDLFFVEDETYKDSHLAWQLIAGVRYAVTPQIDLGAKYRFFSTKFADEIDAFGDDISVKSSIRSHSVLASLIYNFAPPPPPPPPPPAAEPVAPPPPPEPAPVETPPPPPPAPERG